MSARFDVGPFEILIQRAWFAVELIDPIALESVVSDLKVTLVGSESRPIVTGSGRFAWPLRDGAALPQQVSVRSLSRIYADTTYRIQQPPAPVSRELLFRLMLKPLPGYPYTNGMTLVRGRLIETKPLAGQQPRGVGNASVRIRWRNRVGNPPADVDSDGPAAACSASGHFASGLPLPRGALPRMLADDSLNARLVIERPSGALAPMVRISPALQGLKEAQALVLAQPLVWDQL